MKKRRNPEEIELLKGWLNFAKENLLSAKALLDEKFSPFHTISFMCQGSAEKYLKAYLIWDSWTLEKIHDLEQLLKLCVKRDPQFIELLPSCKSLNEYITEGRYPGDLPWEMIGRKEAEEAIAAAEKIEKFVLTRIQIQEENSDFG